LPIARGEEVAEPRSIPLTAYRATVAVADQIEVPATDPGPLASFCRETRELLLYNDLTAFLC
jgi:hypothetical protein